MSSVPERLALTLDQRNPWWFGGWDDRSVPRDRRLDLIAELERTSPFVVVVTGMRRCGKSTLLQQGVAHLLASGRDPTQIWWIDCEDPVFDELGRNATAMDQCLSLLIERHGISESPPFLFVDEIQVVEGWPRWVRLIHETGRARVLVSGSSSTLLESEVARSILTGRTSAIELWPLSFAEYWRFMGFMTGDDPGLLDPAIIRKHFNHYAQEGGMPGLVMERDPEILRERQRQLLDSILLHDVVARHRVRVVEHLRALLHDYFANTANTFTYRRTKDRFGLAMDQARSYTRYLEEAFLIKVVKMFAHKQHEMQRAPRKVHAVDLGLRHAALVTGKADRGHIAESITFMELQRRHKNRQLFWWQQAGAECDIVVQDTLGGTAVQVWMGGAGQVLPERERRGLLAAQTALRLKRGLILTDGYDLDLPGPNRAIPIWRWLLQPERE